MFISSPERRDIYPDVLSPVRSILISRMPRPEEVLIVEDDVGNLIKQRMTDTEMITLYNTMKETLVYLTHLDPEDTEVTQPLLFYFGVFCFI